jgi:hypothetical protein
VLIPLLNQTIDKNIILLNVPSCKRIPSLRLDHNIVRGVIEPFLQRWGSHGHIRSAITWSWHSIMLFFQGDIHIHITWLWNAIHQKNLDFWHSILAFFRLRGGNFDPHLSASGRQQPLGLLFTLFVFEFKSNTETPYCEQNAHLRYPTHSTPHYSGHHHRRNWNSGNPVFWSDHLGSDLWLIQNYFHLQSQQ